MTDEERKKLVTELRKDAPDWTTSGQRVRMLCDEIEHLAKELGEARDIATRMAERWTKAIGIDAGFQND